MLFGSCRAVRGSRASGGYTRWIVLPDDGSFSADTHVATQNTGIARTGSMLLRRRRGYVNWGAKRRAPRRLPPRRGSALPPTTAGACVLPRSVRLRLTRFRSPRCTRRYLCFYQARFKARVRRSMNATFLAFRAYTCLAKGRITSCEIHANAGSTYITISLLLFFWKNFGRYQNFFESNAILFLKCAWISRAFLLSKLSKGFVYFEKIQLSLSRTKLTVLIKNKK